MSDELDRLLAEHQFGSTPTFGTPEKLTPAEGPGAFSQFLNFGAGSLFGALDFLDLGGRSVRKTLGGDFGGAAHDFLSSGAALGFGGATLDMLGLQDTGHFTGGDLLEKAGLHEGTENVFAGMSSRDILGFGVEILLDPLTYVGGAFGKGLSTAGGVGARGTRDLAEGLVGATRASRSADAGRRLADLLERGTHIPLATGAAGAATGFALAEPGEGLEGAFLGGVAGGIGGAGLRGLPRGAELGLATGDFFSDQFRRTRKLVGGASDADRLTSVFNKAQAGIDVTRADAALLRQANEDLLREVISDSASNWISMRTGEPIRTLEEASREMTHMAEQLFTREAALLDDPARAAARGIDPAEHGLGGGSIPLEDLRSGRAGLGKQAGMFGEESGLVVRPGEAEFASPRVAGTPEVPDLSGKSPTGVAPAEQQLIFPEPDLPVEPRKVTVGGEVGQIGRPAIPEKPATPFVPGKDAIAKAQRDFGNLPPQVRKALKNYFLGVESSRFLPGKIAADAHQVQRSILDKLYIDDFILRNELDQLPHVINADSAQTLAQGLYSHLNEIPEVAAKKTLQEKLEKGRQIARAAGADKGVKARKLVGSIDDLNKQFPGLLEDDFLKLGTVDANRYASRIAADDIISHVANDAEWSRAADEIADSTENFWLEVPEQVLPVSMREKFQGRLIRADIWEELFDSRHGVARKIFDNDTPGKLKKAYQAFTSYWSQWTLGPFAGWWARNLVGNFWNSWLAGGISSNPVKAAKQFKDAGVLQDAIASVVNGTPFPTEGIRVGKKLLKGAELEAFALEAANNRLISSGFMTTTAGHQHLRYLSGKDFGLAKGIARGTAIGMTGGAALGFANEDVSAFESTLAGGLAGGAGGAFIAAKAGIWRRNMDRLGRKAGAIESMKQMIAHDPQQSMWVRAGFGLNGVLEDYFRINHYLAKRSAINPATKAAFTAEEAMRDVAKSLGNFTDLSPGDEAVKQLLPFWSWTRFNVPRQFRAFAEGGGKVDVGKLFKGDLGQLRKASPHKVALVGKVKVNLDESNRADVPDEILPEWLQGQLAVPVRRSKDGRLELYSLNRWLPIADLTEIDSPQKMMQYVVNSINPLPGEFLDQAVGRDTFFGAPLERYPGEQEHFFGIPLSKRFVHVLRNARVLSELDRTWGPVFGWTSASDRLKTELDEITTTQAIFRAGTGLKPRPIDLQVQRKRRIKSLQRLIRQMKKDRKAAEQSGHTNAARHLAARIQRERESLQFVRKFDYRRNPHFRALELDQ